MRRLLAAVTTTALAIGVIATTFDSSAQAAPRFTLVDGSAQDPRIMIDASDDGRLVLTERLSSGVQTWRIVRTDTGASVPLPDDAVGPFLSGDGLRLVYATTLALVPGDTDQLLDVYSVAIDDRADVWWLSTGYDSYEMWPMETNRTGSVAVIRADSRALFDGRIVFGSRADTRAMTRVSTNLRVNGITDDGSTVSFSEYDDCTPTPSCLVYRLREFRADTGTVTQRQLRVGGAAVEGYEVAIDGDATCVAFVRFDAFGLWKSCAGEDAVRISSSLVRMGPYARCPAIDLSRDGGRIAWLEDVASRINAVVEPSAQPFVLGPMGSPELQTVNAPSETPSGIAHCVRITDAGTLVEVERDELAPNGGPGVVRTFLRTADSSPATSAPSTTSAVTTAPTTTTPPSSTTPPTTAPTTIAPTTTSTPSTTLAVPPIPSPTAAPSVGSAGPVPGASVFTARTPLRIVDTRDGTGAPAGMPAAGTRITVPIRGRFGVPADATAVAVQLTATEGTAAGYVSLVPDAGALGRTSNLNIDEAGETIANSAVVPIGADGSIVVYTMSPTHLILDLAGWWTPAAGATSAGRFEAVGPTRFLDTRPDSLVGHTGGKPAAGSITTIQVTGRNGVPSTGVSAVVLNVTIDAPASLGFVQVGPAASLVPGSSSTLNVGAVGRVMAASTIVPVDAQGRIALYAQPSTHLVVDVAGWFTGDGAPAALDGMFVALANIDRALDTRGFDGRSPRIAAGGRRQVFTNGGAVVGNLAVTSTAGPGYVQLGPDDTMVNGATSNINPTRAEETVANAFIVPAGAGAVGVYTSVETHVIIDVSGYMTA